MLFLIGRVYKAPKVLRKRKEISDKGDDKPIEPDLEATTVVMHKDSVFYQSWQNFKVSTSVKEWQKLAKIKNLK